MWQESIKDRIRNMGTLTSERKIYNLGLIYDAIIEEKNPEKCIELMADKIRKGSILALHSFAGFLRGSLNHYRNELQRNPLMDEESKLDLLDGILKQEIRTT